MRATQISTKWVINDRSYLDHDFYSGFIVPVGQKSKHMDQLIDHNQASITPHNVQYFLSKAPNLG